MIAEAIRPLKIFRNYMNKKIIEEMQGLSALLNDYAYRYYALDNPIVSDKEYDVLYDRLRALEEGCGIILPGSPTQRIGGGVLKEFNKHTHIARLYSLDKAQSLNELGAWEGRVLKSRPGLKIEYTAEYKFDGLTLSLTYDKGAFLRATTRGDGIIGEDVTEQVKTIRAIPLEIDYKGIVEVQGEGIMRLSELEKYNKIAKIPLKNARNAAAGAIRNLDPKVTKTRNLDIMFYNADTFNDDITTQKDARDFLVKNKFKVSDDFLVTDDFKMIEAKIKQIEGKRAALDFLIDGAVVKINDYRLRKRLGFTEKFPRWAVAYKYEAEEVSTIMTGVEWNVGRTGRLTPLAALTPVELSGATVKKATLNNYEDILRKGIFINSRVFVRRSNDVIPEILGLAERLEDSEAIIKPSVCPSCGAGLIEMGPNLFCPNRSGCRPQIAGKLEHYCSKDAMDIEGLSEKTAELLYDKLNVLTAADLYGITKPQLLSLEGFRDKKADNIIEAIAASRGGTLERFLYALGISNIGKKTARDLAEKYQSIEGLMRADVEELQAVEDVGIVMAQSIVDYFKDGDNITLLHRLFEYGVNPSFKKAAAAGFFSEKRFVLTGVLKNFKRSAAKEIIEKKGGTVLDGVSSSVDFVIAGADAGAKLNKARRAGIRILSEEDFVSKID
jgi:DNA ligase (NAD+)